jgi:hypothetical protein
MRKKYNDFKNDSRIVEDEMTHYLMYHLGISGVSDIALFQINSFSGLNPEAIREHYKIVKSVVKDLLVGNLYDDLPPTDDTFKLDPDYVLRNI